MLAINRVKIRKLLPLQSLHLFLASLSILSYFGLVCGAENTQFGISCDLSQPCDISQGLVCISNICQCDSPTNQRYNNASRKCVSVVGGPCTTTNGAGQRRECIPNSFCAEKSDESGELYTECQCKSGYIENSNGDCVPGIGQPCSYLPEECNPLGMVVCKNGKCQCLDKLQVYDVGMKRCVSPAGTYCKYERAASSLQLGCVKNAICYPFFYWIPPKCLCKPGYTQTKSRQCMPESDYNRSHHGVDNVHQDDSPQQNANTRTLPSWQSSSTTTAASNNN